MANAKQIIALLKSYKEKNDPRFYNVAMQIAASEAKKGHQNLARTIKSLVDEAKSDQSKFSKTQSPVPLVRPKGELADLLTAKYPKERLSDMILADAISLRLKRVIKEQFQKSKIQSFGLVPKHKLLLIGPSGSGKTMTACVLAKELNLPLFTIRLEGVITRFLGETASKLRQIFDAISETKGVYLFDEFDALGSKRTASNDVGEIRRVLNSFLQFLEEDISDSLIIATTNFPELLDSALFRRFDDVIEYALPDKAMIRRIIETRLSSFVVSKINWKVILHASEGLSHSDIFKSCEEAIKTAILANVKKIDSNDLLKELKNRQTHK